MPSELGIICGVTGNCAAGTWPGNACPADVVRQGPDVPIWEAEDSSCDIPSMKMANARSDPAHDILELGWASDAEPSYR